MVIKFITTTSEAIPKFLATNPAIGSYIIVGDYLYYNLEVTDIQDTLDLGFAMVGKV
jgi:hypothetical protein